MKKKCFLILTFAVVFIAVFSLNAAASPLSITLNGESLVSDVEPLEVKGHLFVPLRVIAESLGAKVEWLDTPPTVIISRGDATIEMQPGSKKVLINSGEFNLEPVPQMINGRILVPLRFVSEALGAQVDWQPYTRSVVIKDPASKTYAEHKPLENLPVVGSLENLKKLLEEAEPFYVFGGIRRAADEAGWAAAGANQNEMVQKTAPEVPAPSASRDHSQTNIQVQGVDEADIVKTDGTYIYQVNRGRIVIAKAYPPGEMEICTTLEFDDKNFTPREIYVDEGHLVVIGASGKEIPVTREPVIYSDAKMKIYPPPFYFHNTVKTIIFDIRDRKNIKELREVELEGHYVSSRKIGSSLYLVANKNIDYYYILEDGAENPAPSYRDSAVKDEFISIGLEEIRYFPGFTRPNYLIVAGLNLDRPDEQAEVRTFLGAGENIYASPQNLYATVTGYGNTVTKIPDYDPSTYIYKFALDNGKINYLAKGKVPGTVLNQFSMDEYDGHFRVATTSGIPWGSGEDASRNNIFTLDKKLNLKGKIEDIAPGEKIYSVRFMGKKGYMVTFRTMDPLFVIDLENPENPRVLGALKIPGYSDYLHPYDENHIIGFGKDTMEIMHKDSRGNTINTGVIDLGIKMALFDVSDVQNPVEIFKEAIGGRGTTSELLHNHKALLFSKEKNLLAFPVTVMESQSNTGTMPDYGVFTFQGAYVYNLDLTGGFQLKGRITHLTAEDYLKAGRHLYDSNKQVERIIYIKDVLYTLSQGVFKASGISNLEEINSLSVP
jgi:inhibitor of cysteine peptidase